MQSLLVSGQLNYRLRRYYHNHVAMKELVTKERVREILQLVDRILDYINKKDPRFSKDRLCIGSYWQNLKVGEADEFDFNVPLVSQGDRYWGGTNQDRWYRYSKPMKGGQTITAPLDLDIIATRYGPSLDPPPPGYVFLKSTNYLYSGPPVAPNTSRDPDPLEFQSASSMQATRLWEDDTDMVRQGDLVPFLVRKRFKELLTMALRDLKLQASPIALNGPAFTIKVTVANGEIHGDSGASKVANAEVSIDFSLIVPVRLPFGADIIWPRPGARWPSQDKVDRIKALGINLVARSDFYWLLTFSHSEKILMDGLDADGGCRKQCHRIMKKINSDVWCNTAEKVIDSYVLKTVWLAEMEEFPNKEDWAQDMLGERFMAITRRALDAIGSRYLPMYFNPNVNLMKDKDPTELKSARDKIAKFLKDPRILT